MTSRMLGGAAAMLGAGLLLSAAWGDAGARQAEGDAGLESTYAAGHQVAEILSQITGAAISPLFGISAVSAIQYLRTEEPARHDLPWYNEPWFWAAGLGLVALFLLNTQIGTVHPLLKKPMDVVEQFEDKVSAGLACPILAFQAATLVSGLVTTPTAAPDVGIARMPIHVAGLDLGPAQLLGALTFFVAAALFVVVWMASHSINVLILLSPWGGLDNILRAIKGSLIAMLAGSSALNPYLGALLAVAVICIAYFVAGWSFRLTVFGTVCSWDLATLRHRRFDAANARLWSFVHDRRQAVAARTYGVLRRGKEERMSFTFRPWLILPAQAIEVEAQDLVVRRGVFSPTIAGRQGDAEGGLTLFRLPPRYRSHEEEVAARLGIARVEQAPVLTGIRNAWHWLKARLGLDSGAPSPESSTS